MKQKFTTSEELFRNANPQNHYLAEAARNHTSSQIDYYDANSNYEIGNDQDDDEMPELIDAAPAQLTENTNSNSQNEPEEELEEELEEAPAKTNPWSIPAIGRKVLASVLSLASLTGVGAGSQTTQNLRGGNALTTNALPDSIGSNQFNPLVFGRPTFAPTFRPSGQPTGQPSRQPTSYPTSPTSQPSGQPTGQPSRQPTGQPSEPPSGQPTGQPSRQPTGQPTAQPTTKPTGQPSRQPTDQPSGQPTHQPNAQPTAQPNSSPTGQPTNKSTSSPTLAPVANPTLSPTRNPTTVSPTTNPTTNPTTLQDTHHERGDNNFKKIGIIVAEALAGVVGIVLFKKAAEETLKKRNVANQTYQPVDGNLEMINANQEEELATISSDNKLQQYYDSIQKNINSAFVVAVAISSDKIATKDPKTARALNLSAQTASVPIVSSVLVGSAEAAHMIGSEWRKQRYVNFTNLVPSHDPVEISNFTKTLAKELTIKNQDVIKAQTQENINQFCAEKSAEVIEYVLDHNLAGINRGEDAIKKITDNFTYQNTTQQTASSSGSNIPNTATQPIQALRTASSNQIGITGGIGNP